MKNKTKDRIIKYLLSLDREYINNSIQVSISKKSLETSQLSDIGEEELINQLALMEAEGLITLEFSTAHRNLKYYINIILEPPILNYFLMKKKNAKHIIWEVIKFAVPTIISIIALLKSI